MNINHLKIMLASIGILATLSAIQGMDEKPNESTIANSFSTETNVEYNNIQLDKIDYNSQMPSLYHTSDGGYDMNTMCAINSCNLILTIIIIGAQFL
jgi:hypothetical protein